MVDIEATGGLVTGGLIATAIERSAGKAGEEDQDHHCSDCGETVTKNFCPNCGQPTHVHRSLMHLGEELLHGVLHFDARIWRTLPLLIGNPGRLTREWIEGMRTRYVSPLGLFLFTVFLMFFVLSFTAGQVLEQAPLPERLAAARTAAADAKENLAAAQARTGTAKATRGELAGLGAAVTATEGAVRALEEPQAAAPRADGLAPGSWQASLADAVHSGDIHIGIGDEKAQEKMLHKLGNPDLAVYKLQQTAYKFAFLLVPLSIPFVWLLFAWKRGFTWYDHGVFVLYSLTFMSIFAMVMGFLGRLGGFGATLASLATLGVPVHMFAQLKGAYGLSIFSALWRTVALLVFCVIVITLFLIAILYLGLTG